MRESRTWKLFTIHAKLTLVENTEQLLENNPNNARDIPHTFAPEPVPNNPPWGIPVAIGLWIFSVLMILIIPSIFLLPYLATLNPAILETDTLIEFAKSDRTAVLLQVLAVIPAHIFTLLAAWLVVTRNRKFSFRKTLGWANGGVMWWHYLVFLAGFMAIAATVSHFVPQQDNDLVRILHSSRKVAYLIAFLATVTAPIVEEVVYRGVLYSAFQRAAGVPAAFLLVTFLFAVVHVPQYYPSYSTIFLLALLSVTLTFLRVWSKNLLPCIILHTLFNGLQSILMVADTISGGAKPHENAAFLFNIFK